MSELALISGKNAQSIIENHSALALIAGAVPYPLVSGMAVKSIQLKMIYQLSVEYRLPFSENLAKSILLIIMAGFIASVVVKVFNVFVPRTSALGLASNLMTLAIGAGAETYAVGYIMKQHFESGGTLRDFNFKKSRKHLAGLYEEGKSVVKKMADKKHAPEDALNTNSDIGESK